MESGADELRLVWSARGLAYLLAKRGIEGPLPVGPRGDRAAWVELRLVGGEVREVRWAAPTGSARGAPGAPEGQP